MHLYKDLDFQSILALVVGGVDKVIAEGGILKYDYEHLQMALSR